MVVIVVCGLMNYKLQVALLNFRRNLPWLPLGEYIVFFFFFFHFENFKFGFVFALLPFVPHALESNQVTSHLEGKIHLVLPLSFFLLVFQLKSGYFHFFFHRNFLPLTWHPSTLSDTNRQHLPPSPLKVFLF